MTTAVNAALMQIPKRAEQKGRDYLVRSFVEIGPLLILLSTLDHQVVYGRRGTGKTHALRYFASLMEQRGDIALYIDMRTIGSAAESYSASGNDVIRRANQLLQDSLAALHGQLVDVAFDEEISERSSSALLPNLDQLLDASTQVEIEGDFEYESTSRRSSEETGDVGFEIGIDNAGPHAKMRIETGDSVTTGHETRALGRGRSMPRINFAGVSTALRRVVESLTGRRVWILIDEWSNVPADLQPFLADLIRRCVLPVPDCTVKIAAIEQRTRFRIDSDADSYVGLELGADIVANLSPELLT